MLLNIRKDKNKKLIIVGDGEFGEIAYEYFTYDSEYEVEAFAVERKYRTKSVMFGKPVIDLEDMPTVYPKDEYEVFVAITYTKFNSVRTRLYKQCKMWGYHCASYLSSHAFIWHNVKVGENTFVFEDNTIQYYAVIGNNTILWSGNHVGHRSVIGNNCWLTSHIVISGFSKVGNGCFLGVNSTVCDCVEIADEIVLGAGALVTKNLKEKGQVYIGSPAHLMGRTSYEQFGLESSK